MNRSPSSTSKVFVPAAAAGAPPLSLLVVAKSRMANSDARSANDDSSAIEVMPKPHLLSRRGGHGPIVSRVGVSVVDIGRLLVLSRQRAAQAALRAGAKVMTPEDLRP